MRRVSRLALRGSKMTSSMLHVLEPLVAGQLLDRQDPLHVVPPLRVATPSADYLGGAWCAARTTTARRSWPAGRWRPPAP